MASLEPSTYVSVVFSGEPCTFGLRSQLDGVVSPFFLLQVLPAIADALSQAQLAFV